MSASGRGLGTCVTAHLAAAEVRRVQHPRARLAEAVQAAAIPGVHPRSDKARVGTPEAVPKCKVAVVV